ncbi:helix-turn-helix domain-containing protein [Pseudarthrobacter sp. Y6]|uniref:helix-turn-helix domain-containing protein n=1 Tax=Pseudarthrobacter sp. Y6 TaxID=3418422 RepID=UPI003CED16C1
MYEDPKPPTPTERRSTFFAALTGRKGAEVSGKSTNIVGMLQTLFPKEGKIDTRRAAERLGVSQRTVQRWAKGEQKPKADNLATLNKRARQAATTKAGRAAAVKSQAQGKLARQGAKITIRGHQGVPGNNAHGDTYTRFRSATMKMTPEQMQDLYIAYAEHGDTGLHDFLEQQYSENYGAGQWNMDFISNIDLNEI